VAKKTLDLAAFKISIHAAHPILLAKAKVLIGEELARQENEIASIEKATQPLTITDADLEPAESPSVQ
jgi:hypothetical protein